MRVLATVFLALAVAACEGSVESTRKVRDYEIQQLFEQDGCVMYRFLDGGDWHYFLTCGNRAQTISKRCRRIGKVMTCKREVIHTAMLPGSSIMEAAQ